MAKVSTGVISPATGRVQVRDTSTGMVSYVDADKAPMGPPAPSPSAPPPASPGGDVVNPPVVKIPDNSEVISRRADGSPNVYRAPDGEKYYAPGSVDYENGWRTESERIQGQKHGTYGPHDGNLIPKGSIVVDAGGGIKVSVTPAELKAMQSFDTGKGEPYPIGSDIYNEVVKGNYRIPVETTSEKGEKGQVLLSPDAAKRIADTEGREQFDLMQKAGIVPGTWVYGEKEGQPVYSEVVEKVKTVAGKRPKLTTEDRERYAQKVLADYKISGTDKYNISKAINELPAELVDAMFDPANVQIARNAERQLRETHKQLPDGQWIDKVSLEVVQNTNKKQYDLLTGQGYDAYEKAVKAAEKTLEPYRKGDGYYIEDALDDDKKAKYKGKGIKEAVELLFDDAVIAETAWKMKGSFYADKPGRDIGKGQLSGKYGGEVTTLHEPSILQRVPSELWAAAGVATLTPLPGDELVVIGIIGGVISAAAVAKFITDWREKHGRNIRVEDVVVVDDAKATFIDPKTLRPLGGIWPLEVPKVLKGLPPVEADRLRKQLQTELVPPRVDTASEMLKPVKVQSLIILDPAITPKDLGIDGLIEAQATAEQSRQKMARPISNLDISKGKIGAGYGYDADVISETASGNKPVGVVVADKANEGLIANAALEKEAINFQGNNSWIVYRPGYSGKMLNEIKELEREHASGGLSYERSLNYDRRLGEILGYSKNDIALFLSRNYPSEIIDKYAPDYYTGLSIMDTASTTNIDWDTVLITLQRDKLKAAFKEYEAARLRLQAKRDMEATSEIKATSDAFLNTARGTALETVAKRLSYDVNTAHEEYLKKMAILAEAKKQFVAALDPQPVRGKPNIADIEAAAGLKLLQLTGQDYKNMNKAELRQVLDQYPDELVLGKAVNVYEDAYTEAIGQSLTREQAKSKALQALKEYVKQSVRVGEKEAVGTRTGAKAITAESTTTATSTGEITATGETTATTTGETTTTTTTTTTTLKLPKPGASEVEKRDYLRKVPGYRAYRRGSLPKLGDKWVVLTWPYGAKDKLTIYGKLPKGARLIRGKGSAGATLYGKGPGPKRPVRIEQGAVDDILQPGGRTLTHISDTGNAFPLSNNRMPRLSGKGFRRLPR